MYYNFDATKDLTIANCTLSTSHVEVRVACSGWDCKPTAIRRSTLTTYRSENFTFLDGCVYIKSSVRPAYEYFFNLFKTLTDSQGVEGNQPSIIQAYLAQPELGLSGGAFWDFPPVHTADDQSFSIRLGHILNTYWMAAIGIDPLLLGQTADYSNTTYFEYAVNKSAPKPDPSNMYNFSETQATVSTQVQILRYNKGWMVILIISTLILLVAAGIGLVLDLQIWVPRLLINVSTLTRCNPNFGVPAGGGALSDEERAKLMADMRIRFGDIKTGDDSDDLVIGDCVETGGHVSRFTKGKLYI
ncbi:hypothetical protein CORC01_01593 [Colletotrichum orchidophilum]|uniref:Uncharacterized protein n=1 Tax=Colletotrichum orchidophilum TaxID=1209926 RepID=A0A1G4BP22_9PEZI|nr:uncharacterized protein CORC01_01593 [Colletotrichum orchidophilum]OHF03209.1 hypothetical protein CORC01_01593 [Colletotrichum orchidophilum]